MTESGESMSDFAQIMHDWRRMCKAYTTEEDACVGCPLEHITEHGCGAIFEEEFADVADWAYLDETVSVWAERNPEPIYPTWGEWFIERGDLIGGWKNIKNIDALRARAAEVFDMTIPADIAEKLRIVPKEATP